MSAPPDAARTHWREQLAAWAIPDEILAAAPRSPWSFSVEGFADRVRRQLEQPHPGHALAREALPDGGSVLDVGCGAGAASIPLVPPAGRVTGVDQSASMLEAFATSVREAGATAVTVEGVWPDVAGRVDVHDVAVCQDVAYNVPDLGAFARALSDHARRRVVVVLPSAHPMRWTAPYWRALHDLDRPSGPTVDDAVAALREVGIAPERTSWTEPTLWAFANLDQAVDQVLRRLCLPDERAEDVRAALEATPPPTERVAWALWWDPGTA